MQQLSQHTQTILSKDPTIQEIKERFGWTDEDLAEIFGLANANGYRNSSARKRMDEAVIRIYKATREDILGRLNALLEDRGDL